MMPSAATRVHSRSNPLELSAIDMPTNNSCTVKQESLRKDEYL